MPIKSAAPLFMPVLYRMDGQLYFSCVGRGAFFAGIIFRANYGMLLARALIYGSGRKASGCAIAAHHAGPVTSSECRLPGLGTGKISPGRCRRWFARGNPFLCIRICISRPGKSGDKRGGHKIMRFHNLSSHPAQRAIYLGSYQDGYC